MVPEPSLLFRAPAAEVVVPELSQVPDTLYCAIPCVTSIRRIAMATLRACAVMRTRRTPDSRCLPVHCTVPALKLQLTLSRYVVPVLGCCSSVGVWSQATKAVEQRGSLPQELELDVTGSNPAKAVPVPW